MALDKHRVPRGGPFGFQKGLVSTLQTIRDTWQITRETQQTKGTTSSFQEFKAYQRDDEGTSGIQGRPTGQLGPLRDTGQTTGQPGHLIRALQGYRADHGGSLHSRVAALRWWWQVSCFGGGGRAVALRWRWRD